MTARRFLRTALPPLLPLLVVLGAAEAAVQLGWVRSFLVPAPSSVAASMVRDWPDLSRGFLDTTRNALIGFALSIAVGVVLAIALSSAAWVQRMFYPYAVFFQTVPIVAIAPLLVIWVGWGRTVATSAFIVSVFPVIANTLSGLLATDPALRDLFRLYGARPLATLLKLRLPYALPSILTGLRVAGGLAVIGAIVGEFITGEGLGGLIQVSRQQQRVDKIFAGLALASLLGLALFVLVNVASRLTLRHWHASESSRGQEP